MAARFDDSTEVELRVGASAAAGVAALPMKQHPHQWSEMEWGFLAMGWFGTWEEMK